VTWWTNIRFEKSFLEICAYCLKLPATVSGGLEVASDRLLKLIDKGDGGAWQSDPQLYRSRVMVHCYLMYGYPTQTVQETVDSLEMVRQLLKQEYCSLAFGINLP
jgi:hypothetical protein